MKERIKDERLEEILTVELRDKELNKKLFLKLAEDLKDERLRRRQLEASLKELEHMLHLLKTLEASKNKLNVIKDELDSKEMKIASEESIHFSPHEKILACSVWLLMRAKNKNDNNSASPSLSSLRENLLEMKSMGQWPGSHLPSPTTLKHWARKYKWEKIFTDYFFSFLMNKGFGVETDPSEFVPELYKRWENEIKDIDEE